MRPRRLLGLFMAVLHLGAVLHGPLVHTARGEPVAAVAEHSGTEAPAAHTGYCVLCHVAGLKLGTSPGAVVSFPAFTTVAFHGETQYYPGARFSVLPLGSRAPPLA
jgi:hypothetical protein